MFPFCWTSLTEAPAASSGDLLGGKIHAQLPAMGLQSLPRRPARSQKANSNRRLRKSLLTSHLFGRHPIHLRFQENPIRRPAHTQDSRDVNSSQIHAGLALGGWLKILVQALIPDYAPVLIERDRIDPGHNHLGIAELR